MLSAAASNGRTVSYLYDTAGSRTKLSYPNGASAKYDYDSTGKLLSLTHKDASRTTLKVSPADTTRFYTDTIKRVDGTGNLLTVAGARNKTLICSFASSSTLVSVRTVRITAFDGLR